MTIISGKRADLFHKTFIKSAGAGKESVLPSRKRGKSAGGNEKLKKCEEVTMYVIAGLGNPGRKYEKTRHNVGFEVIDRLAEKYGISVNEKMFQGLVGRGVIEGEKVLLVKPQTFMNLSGECIQPILGYYKVDPEDFVVVYDDISLEPGNIRVRGKGSAGGHNGIKNIILRLGTQDFPRVRIGTGEKPEKMDLADYVLGHFTPEEQKLMDEAYEAGAEAAVTLILEGTEKAMNRFNGKARQKRASEPLKAAGLSPSEMASGNGKARKQDPDKNGKHGEKHEDNA